MTAPRKPRHPAAVPAVQCSATSKRSGERCKRYALPGATVCRTHGAGAPQVREAAGRRVQEIVLRAQAASTLDKLGVSIETTPIEALEAMLYEAAGAVAVLRAMVNQLPQDRWYGDLFHENGSPTGKAVLHVLIVMHAEERDRLAKLAEACAKLGLDQRRLELAEAQVSRLVDAVNAAMADIGMPKALMDRFRQAIARRLRGGDR